MTQEPHTSFKLNIPLSLKDRLSEAAERSGRSLTSEIITRLQASLTLGDDLGLDFTRESVERLVIDLVQAETGPLDDRIRELEATVSVLWRR